MTNLAPSFSAQRPRDARVSDHQAVSAACQVCGANPVLVSGGRVGLHNEQRIRRGRGGAVETYVSDQRCAGSLQPAEHDAAAS
jgi:hypothetical protein